MEQIIMNETDVLTLYARYKLKNNNIDIIEELQSSDINTFILHVYDNDLLLDPEYHEFKYDDCNEFETMLFRKIKLNKINKILNG